jgi:membrane protease YdiL (CAAX protease family)
MTWLRVLLALVEPVLVFIAAALMSRVLLELPALAEARAVLSDEAAVLLFRWLPLVALALTIDLILRRRGLGAWGVFAPWRAPVASLSALAALVTIAGVPALALTIALDEATPLAIANSEQALGTALALISPLIGQELFLVGYAHRRFSDALPRWPVAIAIALLFALAHAQHAAAGPLGWAFVGSMALQGLLWSFARSAGAPLPLLMLAHLLLLLGYFEPRAAIVVILVLALLTARGWPAWWRHSFIQGNAS